MEQYHQFDRIYAETRDPILRYIIAHTPRAADVEDIFQEVYRSLYIRLQRRGPSIREPLPYLYAAARKELARFTRKNAQRTVAEAPLDERIADDGPAPDEQFFQRADIDEIWALVQNEPLQSYQAFTLFYGFSVPIREIAAQLGISEDAVKQRLSRTRKRIREALTEQGSVAEDAWERRAQ